MHGFHFRAWFPFVSWLIDIRGLSAGGYIARTIMILAVLVVAAAAYFRPVKPKTERIWLIVSAALILLGELLYRGFGMFRQMLGAIIGIPAWLVFLGILLGCGFRFIKGIIRGR